MFFATQCLFKTVTSGSLMENWPVFKHLLKERRQTVSLWHSFAASLEGGGKYGKRGSVFLRLLRKTGLLWVATTWVSGYVEGGKEGSWTEQGLGVVTVPGDSTFRSGLVPALGTFLCPSLQPPPAVNLAITSAPQRVPHGQPLVGLSVTCGLQPASFCLWILGVLEFVCWTSLLSVPGPNPFCLECGAVGVIT